MTITADSPDAVSQRTRPHLVYVTAGFPFPLTSGYLRHHFLIDHLAREHDITLLSLVGGAFPPPTSTRCAR